MVHKVDQRRDKRHQRPTDATQPRTLLKTILKIFCTLIEWLVEQKIKGAFIALLNRFACAHATVRIRLSHSEQRKSQKVSRVRTCRVISSCSSCEKVLKWSYFVPMRNGMAVWGAHSQSRSQGALHTTASLQR